uniref:Uncharacterized protein n=1 Tax=Rhizophora mucronata TaxID=61149 RepID=A0A2P2JAI7_RHIMU
MINYFEVATGNNIYCNHEMIFFFKKIIYNVVKILFKKCQS